MKSFCHLLLSCAALGKARLVYNSFGIMNETIACYLLLFLYLYLYCIFYLGFVVGLATLLLYDPL
jgi:hypothetical protein